MRLNEWRRYVLFGAEVAYALTAQSSAEALSDEARVILFGRCDIARLLSSLFNHETGRAHERL